MIFANVVTGTLTNEDENVIAGLLEKDCSISSNFEQPPPYILSDPLADLGGKREAVPTDERSPSKCPAILD
jgi:hypothetical protein